MFVAITRRDTPELMTRAVFKNLVARLHQLLIEIRLPVCEHGPAFALSVVV
jgi:hypothetical protein